MTDSRTNASDGPSNSDRRGSPRFSLLMRTAKLICRSGEYVCIIRDISETGTKIRLFHELPPEQHFFLELSNGARYGIQLVWHQGDHSGFQFASPVDIAEFAAEPNENEDRAIRLAIDAPATFKTADRGGNAQLVNLSQDGACIETGEPLAVRQRLTLGINFMPERIAYVRWRKGFQHGLVFQQGFSLVELAGHAVTLQPFGDTEFVAQEPKPEGPRRHIA